MDTPIIYYNNSDTDENDYEEFLEEQQQIEKDIKNQDDFDNFLLCYYEAQKYYNFTFLNHVPAFKVYDLIKTDLGSPEDKLIKMFNYELSDFYWCEQLVYSADPELNEKLYELNERVIFNFNQNLMKLNPFKNKNKNYIKCPPILKKTV